MIIIASILQQLVKTVELSLGFATGSTTDTLNSERVIPLGLHFGTTFPSHKNIGIEAKLALQAGVMSKPGRFYSYSSEDSLIASSE
jgi:hypothetical protein